MMDRILSIEILARCFALYALWLVPLAWIALANIAPEVRDFLLLFTFRYLRLIVGIIAYYNPFSGLWFNLPFLPYRRSRRLSRTRGFRYTGADVTVIIPTVAPSGHEFEETVFNALSAGCARVLIVTVGEKSLQQASQMISKMGFLRVSAYAIEVASKRAQVVEGLKYVRTPLVVFADDHVFWPAGPRFLDSLVAPFADSTVGAVGSHKRVRRLPAFPLSWSSLLNLFGCLYLERHNFDLGATNAVDGSVFVVSGRTSAWRSSIVQDPGFTKAFLNEMWFFVNHGWTIKFLTTKDALMETTLGVDGWKKFHHQIIRWARTTPRSNSTSLLADRTIWATQPWGVYAIHLTMFVNYALFTDIALTFLARSAATSVGISVGLATIAMLMWILASKLVKTLPHFARNPQDLVYLPFCIAFSYVHSLYKLYATITAGNVAWGSRPGLVK